jgi:hypothetical protein
MRRAVILGWCRAARLATALALAPCAAAAEQWQGAAFEADRAALEKLAAAGAKVVRVYRESDAWVLDEAQRLGLRVVMGLRVAHPRHGFRLDDAAARQAQEHALRAFVLRHRQHPAILAWGVGNEVETGERDPLPAWREVDRLAGVVKTADPARPTLMVVADTGMAELRTLASCCPSVDLLGVNVYAGAVFDLPQRLREAGIDAAAFDASPLATEWKVVAEATDLRKGGDHETPPARIPVTVLHADAASVRLVAPSQPGAYRLFVTVRDRRGKAATANLPFLVR